VPLPVRIFKAAVQKTEVLEQPHLTKKQKEGKVYP
jgi:hypothetical protein